MTTRNTDQQREVTDQQNDATETDTMHSQRPGRTATTNHQQFRPVACVAMGLAMAAMLSGCAGSLPANFGVNDGGAAANSVHVMGTVYGGQNPVIGATIQLYTVGTTGLKSASTGLISSANEALPGQTLTSSTGGFNISGLYSACNGTTPGTEVYIVATGGDPGSGSTNASLALAAALGDCTTIYNNAANVHILLNEVTTVAAAYALAPFAQDITHIGASGNEPAGLVNAFANVNLLANNANGFAGGPNLATGVAVPVAEINTISNILAACVNSTGAGDNGACDRLFAGTGATDTFTAGIKMAQNPGSPLITSLYTLPTGQVPFNPSLALSAAPNDFSIAVTYSGPANTLSTPSGIAIDASGNAWVANESGSTIAEFTPSGTAASYTASGLYGPQGIAVDNNSNVWVANTAGNSVIEFPSGNVNSPVPYTSGGIDAPAALAIDSQNDVWIANYNGNSVTELSGSNGSPLNGSPLLANGTITVPSGIALDRSGNAYVTSGSGSVIELNPSGAYSATLNDGALQGPVSVALDTSNRVYVSGFTTGTASSGAFSEFSGGTAASASPFTYGLSATSGLASDGQFIYVLNNSASGGVLRFIYGQSQPLNPVAGFAAGSLNLPTGIALDSAGCIWVTNAGSNLVTKFIGLSNPVTTPVAANVGP